MPECMHVRCHEDSHWTVGLLMWPRGYPKDSHPPVESSTGLGVCQMHGVLTTPADVLSDTGKVQIEAAFTAIGRALPDWNTVEVVLLPLESPAAMDPPNPSPGST